MKTAADGGGNDLAATSHETVDQLVGSIRDGTPIRIGFAQRRVGDEKVPGPLSEFVTNGDHRGLLLFLLAMSRATRSDPWNVVLSSAVWARALNLPLPNSKGAASSISKAWLRIENRDLIMRTRSGRLANITLRREDGVGEDYVHPKDEGGYFKLPAAFWLRGPDLRRERWYEVLDLPAVAMLLVASSHQPGFSLPVEKAPEWYGFSADTAHRGLATLGKHGILEIKKQYRKEPLAPLGYTYVNRYTLQAPFSHRRGSARRKRKPMAK